MLRILANCRFYCPKSDIGVLQMKLRLIFFNNKLAHFDFGSKVKTESTQQASWIVWYKLFVTCMGLPILQQVAWNASQPYFYVQL